MCVFFKWMPDRKLFSLSAQCVIICLSLNFCCDVDSQKRHKPRLQICKFSCLQLVQYLKFKFISVLENKNNF